MDVKIVSIDKTWWEGRRGFKISIRFEVEQAEIFKKDINIICEDLARYLFGIFNHEITLQEIKVGKNRGKFDYDIEIKLPEVKI